MSSLRFRRVCAGMYVTHDGRFMVSQQDYCKRWFIHEADPDGEFDFPAFGMAFETKWEAVMFLEDELGRRSRRKGQ